MVSSLPSASYFATCGAFKHVVNNVPMRLKML
jgi:hypothetical protein